MKNRLFTNVLGVLAGLAVAGTGFMLLPGNDDLRGQAARQAAKEFIRDFNGAQQVTSGENLPEATLLSSEGRKVDLSALTNGHVTIVNFWASWCAPCLEELPSLASLQQKNPDVLIMAVSLDMQNMRPGIEKIFQNPALRDLRWFYDETGDLRKKLNLKAYPSTYVLDKKGRIIYILQGPADWASPEALKFSQSLINNY